MTCHKKTPGERYLENQLVEVEKTKKMDQELAKYGRPVRGGTIWTAGDLARFFVDQKKKKVKY